jgi:polysaccharide biosynthesis transport protein
MTTAERTPTVPLKPAQVVRTTAPRRPAPAPVEAESSLSVGRLVAWLKLYWLTILFCGSLLGAVLGYLAWSLTPSKYESYATLRVASAPFNVSSNRDPNRSKTDFVTYLKTNSKLIKNEFVLNAALNLIDDGVRIADLPTINEQKNPFQFLDDELQVTNPDQSELIMITMKGHRPDDVRRIVNAVQQAFMNQVVDKEIRERKENLEVLDSTLMKLEDTLKKGAGPNAFDLPVGKPADGGIVPAVATAPVGPPEWVKKQVAGLKVSRVFALQEQVLELPVAIENQKNRLAAIKRSIEAPPAEPTQVPTEGSPTPDMLQAAVDNDPEVRALAAEESRLRREAGLERSRYANPNAPSIVAKIQRADGVAVDIESLRRQKLKALEQAYAARPTPGVKKPSEKIAEYEAVALRLQELETQYAAAKQRFASAQEELSKLPSDPPAEIKAVEHRQAKDERKTPDPDLSKAEAEDSIFRNLARDAYALRLDLSSPRRVSVYQQASTPMQRDGKKQFLFAAFAALIGFALVGLVAIGSEVIANRVCSLADVKNTRGLPVVGVLPGQPTEATPAAEVRECVDKLRAYVTQTWLPRGANLIAVTSPLTDDGRAFTAHALAAALAEAGYRTLLVDFDLRNPCVHRFAGVENLAGVCELLRGESTFSETMKFATNGLMVLTAGRWSDDARRMAGSGRLEQLVQCLREPFDCVIVHGHSLLATAESLEVVRRCEAVLMCTLCRETRVPLVRTAAERLADMDVPFAGLVYLGATPQEALC